MKTNDQFLSLNDEEMQKVSGGDFAYDFGFFLREIGISLINGGSTSGAIAVAMDLGRNYRPLQ